MKLFGKMWRLVGADDPPPVVTDPPPVVTDPPPVVTDPPVTPPVDDDKPTISNKKMNAIVAAEKRKFQEQQQQTIKQLETLQKAKGLSDKEKDGLASQIEDLKNSMLTKEQLAAKEREKLQNEHREKLTEQQQKAEKNWKLYEESTIKRSIVDAASTNDAYRASQIVEILEKKTQLVEDKDGDGRGLGTFTPHVKFPDTKDNKPIILDLTVEEAVKRMKDMPDEFGNLFKSGVVGGLGGSGGTGGGGATDKEAPADPEKFRIWREKQKKLGKL